MSNHFLVLAQNGSSFTSMLPLFAVLIAIMYFLMIRPQQKQVKEQRSMLAALKKGDDVITQGGLLGKVFLVTDKLVTLEVASNVRVRILKSSIQGKVQGLEEESKGEEKKEAK